MAQNEITELFWFYNYEFSLYTTKRSYFDYSIILQSGKFTNNYIVTVIWKLARLKEHPVISLL